MTTRLVCADLGYSCDWMTAGAEISEVVGQAVGHLREEHRVAVDSPALRTYVQAHAEEAHDESGQLLSRHRLPTPVARVATRYRRITMAGRVSIVMVSIAALLMIALLYRTQTNAAAIQEKAALIAQSGRGINEHTDSLLQLNKTNELAGDIRDSLAPLNRDMGEISSLSGAAASNLESINSSSRSIEGSAKSIDTSTRAIDRDVRAIADAIPAVNTRLEGINGNAAGILSTAESLARGIDLIGSDLDSTAGLATQVLRDAQGIRTRLDTTRHYASCIDNGLNGGSDCERKHNR
ncbi:DUF1059 domain-containing protein [Nocardioides sp. NPDC051685]|uniref:DUF1059 domain-containing protein n=1 Tax=Nocardioides sp. NPDC051685 TaxID=3364334 RepID=UPI003796766A